MKKVRGWWLLFLAPMLAASVVIWFSASGMEQWSISIISFLAFCGLLCMFAVSEIAYHFWPKPAVVAMRVIFFASLLSVGAIPLTHWPLRASVRIWERPLRDIHDRVARGEPVSTPVRVGPFYVHKTMTVHGVKPRLILDTNESGETSLLLAKEPPGNEWSYIILHDDWILFAED